MKRRSEDKKSKVSWSASEDDALLKAILEDKQDREAEAGEAEDEEDWDEIAKSIAGKTPVQCLKRYMVINSRKSGESSSKSDTAESNTNADAEEDKKTASGQTEGGDAEEDADDEEEKEPKRARKEGDVSLRWPQDDLDLLKKLVENYKDCKLKERVQCWLQLYLARFSLLLFSCFCSRSCASLERDSREFFK